MLSSVGRLVCWRHRISGNDRQQDRNGNLWGFRYSADDVVGSGGSLVIVDEAAEDWSPSTAMVAPVM
jgi:hypothetical protein